MGAMTSTPSRLILATRNAGKIAELHAILSDAGLPHELVGADAYPEIPDVKETGVTFAENALLKAHALARATGLPAVADDSGLCVDVLNGAPGIFSARWWRPRRRRGQPPPPAGAARRHRRGAPRRPLLLRGGPGPPGRHRTRRRGPPPGHPAPRPVGHGRLRLRPDPPAAGRVPHLRGAHPGGEERHLPPRPGLPRPGPGGPRTPGLTRQGLFSRVRENRPCSSSAPGRIRTDIRGHLKTAAHQVAYGRKRGTLYCARRSRGRCTRGLTTVPPCSTPGVRYRVAVGAEQPQVFPLVVAPVAVDVVDLQR